jgi:hypothetical protein
MEYFFKRFRKIERQTIWITLELTGGVLLILLIGNIAQVSIWAILFQLLGEFPSLQEAVYHSAVNFSTLGYGDIVMSERHRFLGPLQAMNGVLMIGLSTATLTTALHHCIRAYLQQQVGEAEDSSN